ncbi:MAG: single-stranded-DNA-specific exonuclease RecJ [Thermoflexales bacterium]
MNRVWQLSPQAPEEFIHALAPLHRLAAQVVYARGFTNPEAAREFLNTADVRTAHLPGKDFSLAVERLLRAAAAGERIAIYGDYDVDGVTSCALLNEALALLGAQSRVYIPNRFDEGYGLNTAALEQLHSQGVGVVVTVDCGVRGFAEVERARQLGLDLIITDHHELEDGRVPEAFAVVNPKQELEAAALHSLAGVGVTYLLAKALIERGRRAGMMRNEADPSAWLELVALGTVADMVSLIGVNRALTQRGLEHLRHTQRPGLRALMSIAGLNAAALSAEHISFALAPRLNAAGRLESAYQALNLLLTSNEAHAQELARALDQHNRYRQALTQQVFEDAEQRALADDPQPPLLFAAGEYHVGVVGLAAQRLAERHYQPAVVVGVEDNLGRGSCRSVDGFHITRALDICRGLLLKHGGHDMAAGFTVNAEHIPSLKDCLMRVAAAHRPPGGWQRLFRADAMLDALTLRECAIWDSPAMRSLALLQPHGSGNPRPLFWLKGLKLQRMRLFGGSSKESHLRLTVRDSLGTLWDLKGWRMGTRLSDVSVGDALEALVHLEWSNWNGEPRLELQMVDFRVTG